MSPNPFVSGLGRRTMLSALALLPTFSGALLPVPASAQTATSGAPLVSWNDGAAKQAILDFVRDTGRPRKFQTMSASGGAHSGF